MAAAAARADERGRRCSTRWTSSRTSTPTPTPQLRSSAMLAMTRPGRAGGRGTTRRRTAPRTTAEPPRGRRRASPATMAQALNTRAARRHADGPRRSRSSARTSACSAASSGSPTGSPRSSASSRCFDTPLAESGIVGMAVGMAMNGMRPVVEMQFDAFAYPAFEQIVSHVAKMRNRTRGAVPLPHRHPGPVRRRHRRSRAPLRLLRGLLRAHARACRSSPRPRSRTPTGCCAKPSPPTTR